MRIVLDTNIYIAAALQGEFIEDIVEMIIKTSGITVITSEDILLELQQKLQVKFKWLSEDINLLITKIRNFAEIVETTETLEVITRDPGDNKILECALAGKADLIVSSDQDLIALKSFRGIGIIHPKTLSWTFPEYFKKSKK